VLVDGLHRRVADTADRRHTRKKQRRFAPERHHLRPLPPFTVGKAPVGVGDLVTIRLPSKGPLQTVRAERMPPWAVRPKRERQLRGRPGRQGVSLHRAHGGGGCFAIIWAAARALYYSITRRIESKIDSTRLPPGWRDWRH
jgi:hypothetical protein